MVATGKLQGKPEMVRILAKNLLLGIYRKLVCQKFIKEIVENIEIPSTEHSMSQAILIAAQIQDKISAKIDYIPYTVRVLMCYMIAGGSPSEIQLDFGIVYENLFQPWLLTSIEDYLSDICT